MPENIFYVDFRQKECTKHYQKYIFQIKYFNLLFLSGYELPQVFQWLFFAPFDYTWNLPVMGFWHIFDTLGTSLFDLI